MPRRDLEVESYMDVGLREELRGLGLEIAAQVRDGAHIDLIRNLVGMAKSLADDIAETEKENRDRAQAERDADPELRDWIARRGY